MLIPLDIVNYNLGSSCLIIDISILCLGAMRSECVPTWTKHGVAEEMAVLRTLLHALIIWIVLLLVRQLAGWHYIPCIHFSNDLQEIHETVPNFT